MRLALKALAVVGLSLALTGCHTYGHHGHGHYYDRALYSDPDEADLYDAAFYEDFNQELAQTWAARALKTPGLPATSWSWWRHVRHYRRLHQHPRPKRPLGPR